MIKVLMVNSIPGIWEPTDKFKFTGKWKCRPIYDYCDTDIEFEVEIKINFIKRWWKNIPKYDWVDSARFIDVNVCSQVRGSQLLF